MHLTETQCGVSPFSTSTVGWFYECSPYFLCQSCRKEATRAPQPLPAFSRSERESTSSISIIIIINRLRTEPMRHYSFVIQPLLTNFLPYLPGTGSCAMARGPSRDENLDHQDLHNHLAPRAHIVAVLRGHSWSIPLTNGHTQACRSTSQQHQSLSNTSERLSRHQHRVEKQTLRGISAWLPSQPARCLVDPFRRPISVSTLDESSLHVATTFHIRMASMPLCSTRRSPSRIVTIHYNL
jgi:hypothetical protein